MVTECLTRHFDENVRIEEHNSSTPSFIGFSIDNYSYLITTTTEMPCIILKDKTKTHPHFLLNPINIGDTTFQHICLYEENQYSFFAHSYEERLEFTIERFYTLLNLSNLDKEREYQKEFLYYWRSNSTIALSLFLSKDDELQELDNLVHRKSREVRYYNRDSVSFNDTDNENWFSRDSSCIYVPISNKSNILPPINENSWDSSNILGIIENYETSKISRNSYNYFLNKSFGEKSLDIIWGMHLNNIIIHFGTRLTFKNSGEFKLIEKVRNQIKDITLLSVERLDYTYLNMMIGNDNNLNKKTIAIIGAGSLGSYVSRELSKCGVKNFIIADSDSYSSENYMRHTFPLFYKNSNKALLQKLDLERLHPEVHVKACRQNISRENLLEEMGDADLIIFTIGNSDTQLELNHFFREKNIQIPTIFAWLEAGGESSHVFFTSHNSQGCYQCLHTDANGDFCDNKINVAQEVDPSEHLIRNGCGGVRVAYGNNVLLQASQIILSAVQKVLSSKESPNPFVLSSTNGMMENIDDIFSKKCEVCSEF